MSEDRRFPPSARRTALARAAGVTAASPVVVGALACAAAALALALTAGTAADRLGATLRESIDAAGTRSVADTAALGVTPDDGAIVPGAVAAQRSERLGAHHLDAAGAQPSRTLGAHPPDAAAAQPPRTIGANLASAPLVDARGVVTAVGALVFPLLVALAIAALLAHLAQTRGVWLPRRKLLGAPTADPMRAAHAGLSIANGAVIGLVTLGWLYAMAPRLAALGVVPSAGGLMIISFVAALAVAWVALGVIDALVRYAGYAAGMRMTRVEQREDARLASADPRWRQRREKLARTETPASVAVAGSSVLLLGDGLAVAIAWDPLHRPIPTRTAIGRAARATQLLGLARRRSLPVHRDMELAVLLATEEGPVPERLWARLAEVIAAVRPR